MAIFGIRDTKPQLNELGDRMVAGEFTRCWGWTKLTIKDWEGSAVVRSDRHLDDDGPRSHVGIDGTGPAKAGGVSAGVVGRCERCDGGVGWGRKKGSCDNDRIPELNPKIGRASCRERV